MKKYINDAFPHLLHGGDYNPEQWLGTKEIFDQDMKLMKEANCNEMTLGVFSWSTIEPEEGKFDFSFLDEGNYQAEIFADGVNADKDATDYHRQVKTITNKDKLSFYMAPGGGWTAILKLAD